MCVRLFAASGGMTQQELNERTKRQPTHVGAEGLLWSAFTSVFVYSLWANYRLRQKPGETSEQDGAAVAAVHYHFPFSSHQSRPLVPLLPTRYCVVMCSHPYIPRVPA